MNIELMTEIDQITDDFADKKTREAVERAERLRLGTWVPQVLYGDRWFYDMQTVELVVKNVNQWLDYLAGAQYAKRYHYAIREVGDTFQVYQPGREEEDRQQDSFQGHPGIEGPEDSA